MRARAWICLFGLLLTSAPTAWAKRAACVGDSITYGSGITNRMYDSYPAQRERELAALGMDWEVDNFGVSTTSASIRRRSCPTSEPTVP